MVSLLPQAFLFSGTVIDGEKVGRTLGFPTANLHSCPSETELAPGVYFGNCTVADSPSIFDSLVYFGPRYIFGETRNNFEVYIYDFNQQIYGQKVFTTLTHFLRQPVKFSSMKELQQGLEQDKARGQKMRSSL